MGIICRPEKRLNHLRAIPFEIPIGVIKYARGVPGKKYAAGGGEGHQKNMRGGGRGKNMQGRSTKKIKYVQGGRRKK